MKITDEHMKELVKFARATRLYMENYEQLFSNCNQALLVQICYNTNRDLEEYCYNTNRDLEEKFDTKLPLAFVENNAANRRRQAFDLLKYDCFDHVAVATQYVINVINVFHSVYTVTGLTNTQPNTTKIIIKTILDYYGEDYQTFEVLYL